MGTKRLLAHSKEKKVKHFVYLSSACVFPGDNPNAMENEDSIPYPKNFYGITKLLAEEIAKCYNSPQMNVTVVRTNFTSMPWEYPSAFTDRVGTYLFATGVAKGLKEILVKRPSHPIIHVCGNRKMSMYEYAIAGKSKVGKMTMNDYKGPSLTINMSLTSKYWKLYKLEDSDYLDS